MVLPEPSCVAEVADVAVAALPVVPTVNNPEELMIGTLPDAVPVLHVAAVPNVVLMVAHCCAVNDELLRVYSYAHAVPLYLNLSY